MRRLIQQDFLGAFDTCDVIVCPVTPGPAFRMAEKTSNPLTMYLEDIYTVSVSLAGLPAVSVPCGTVGHEPALPVGMQIVGPHFEEGRILRAAWRYERETGAGKP